MTEAEIRRIVREEIAAHEAEKRDRLLAEQEEAGEQMAEIWERIPPREGET